MPTVALVDFGAGNLASVRRACERCGLETSVAASPNDILAADGIVLPGVGAFGKAMETLRGSGLANALCESVAADRPLLAICLGMQLLMERSNEFGAHEGLGLVAGHVERLRAHQQNGRAEKVPHVGWSAVHRVGPSAMVGAEDDPLDGVEDPAFMCFMHSYVVRPTDAGVISTSTRHGADTFCSSLRLGRIFATQFHPERSGPAGLRIYRNFAAAVTRAPRRQEDPCAA